MQTKYNAPSATMSTMCGFFSATGAPIAAEVNKSDIAVAEVTPIGAASSQLCRGAGSRS